MRKKQLNKYIKELDQVLATSTYDVKLIASITNRLDQIESRKELNHFIETLKVFRDCNTYTASDYKFYDKVINRLATIAKKDTK